MCGIVCAFDLKQSAGGMVDSGDSLKFKGKLSLENNGGFSSVRRFVSQDLSSASRVRLVVRRAVRARPRRPGRVCEAAARGDRPDPR